MLSLKNWNLSTSNGDVVVGFSNGIPIIEDCEEAKGHIIAHGEAYGHHKFSDGTQIHTSRVEELVEDEAHQCFRMVTHSGSRYELKYEEAKIEAFEGTIDILQKFSISEKTLLKCRTLSERMAEERKKQEEMRKNQRMKEAESALLSNELYIIYADEEMYSYFKYDNSDVREIPVRVHLGMFEDSYLIQDKQLDVSFFKKFDWQSASHILKPYRICGLKVIKLKNASSQDVKFVWEDASFLCKKDDVTTIQIS